MLDYQMVSNWHTMGLYEREVRKSKEEVGSRDWSNVRKEPPAKEFRQPPGAREDRNQTLPWSLQERPACLHLHCSSERLNLDFWPPELEENKWVLFEDSLW